MSNIREQLNMRRAELRNAEHVFLEDLHFGARHPRYDAAARALAELRQIEGILATFQLADAQMKLVTAQELATQAQREATLEQQRANQADSQAKSASEEETFWKRRFLNTIALASAAAFVSVLTFATKTDSPYVPADDLGNMLFAFGSAATLGAVTPIFQLLDIYNRGIGARVKAIPEDHPRFSTKIGKLMLRLYKTAKKWDASGWIIPAATGLLFVMGMMMAMGSVQGYLSAKPTVSTKPAPIEVRVIYVPVSTPSPAPPQ